MSVIVRALVVSVVVSALVTGAARPAEALTVEQARLAATRAIGAGEGDRAARIIARNGLATRPAVLGRVIYDAGVLAVGADLGDEFSQAVATAFVDGGVGFATAQRAFLHGSVLVVRAAPTDRQLLREIGPGGVAILRTELAYLGLTLPALGFL